MPEPQVWTGGQDTQIRRLRTEGASWDMIARALGVARSLVMERGRLIGVEQPPANAVAALDESDRPPLPAGHAETWGAINRGHALDGVPFRAPNTIR